MTSTLCQSKIDFKLTALNLPFNRLISFQPAARHALRAVERPQPVMYVLKIACFPGQLRVLVYVQLGLSVKPRPFGAKVSR